MKRPACFVLCVFVGIVLLGAPRDVSADSTSAKPNLDPASTEPVSFRREVIAVLTRGGCNSGACHGSPSGKGGLRLSLLGFDPAQDHATLTREVGGRRIDRTNPSASLLLRKACGMTDHEGGPIFSTGTVQYGILARWIGAGAALDNDAPSTAVRNLELMPGSATLETPSGKLQMHAKATFADGTTRDVSHLVQYRSSDDMIGKVSPGGAVRFQRSGEAAILGRYLSAIDTALLTHLAQEQLASWNPPPAKKKIDELAFENLRRLRIHPSPLCTDAEFARRVSLDLTGRLLPPDRVRAFLADADPGKRARLIDELLESSGYVDFWTLKWSDLLGCNQRFVGERGAFIFHQWIKQQVAANLPIDEFVRTIVAAEGGNYRNPPAGFYRRLRLPEDHAESVSQLFLGVRMQCARCHNHPFERWMQDDYYGLAAFFRRIKFKNGQTFVHMYNKEEVVYQERTGEMVHPRSGATVPPTPLGGLPMPEAADDRLSALAEWIASPENPFFARTLVNRYWFHLFGKGIVDPVDDFRTSNPASHPAVLDALTKDFIGSRFDAKHLLRTIANSSLYQLSATANSNAEDERYFSHASIRQLTAEQLFDAITDVTEVPEKIGALPLGTKASQIHDGEYQHPFLKAFGKPAKSIACECERSSDSSLEQSIGLIAGPFISKRIDSDSSRIARLIARKASDEAIVEEIYLAALSRLPTPAEREFIAGRLKAAGGDRRKVLEDVLWGVLNLEEFLFQH